MKIVCAPASFKECLTAAEVAEAMAEGVRRADPQIACDVCPVGDGGEGTMEALVSAMGGAFQHSQVIGPLGDLVEARFAILADQTSAVVELAEASGLALVPNDRRDPIRTTTYGTGELIRHAIALGCTEIIVCIGGSATVDGGTGIAQALGAKFFDQCDQLIDSRMCGGMLCDIARIELPRRDDLPRIRVACDVTNPLCGPQGAAAVYGPQKGATPSQVRLLDDGLAHLAKIVGGDPNVPGSGAAGGAGFGLANVCGARLERGIDLVLDAVGFDERVHGADLVLTGEGRLDAQSLNGKACMGVARRAVGFGIPTFAIVGSTGTGAEDCVDPACGGVLKHFVNLSALFGEQRALNQASSLIADVAAQIAQGRGGKEEFLCG